MTRFLEFLEMCFYFNTDTSFLQTKSFNKFHLISHLFFQETISIIKGIIIRTYNYILTQKGLPMYRIFIVEDDEIIANLLKKNLCSWGYDVSCAEDFSNIIQEFAHRDPQLVLLDLKLPFYNGFHWCEEIRKISQVPIIFISSASDNMNMVMAMSRGADDFIAKPFDLDVLTAKIQAILRRTYSFGTPGNVLEHKGAVLNPSRCTLTWNGHDIDLTKNELRILEILLEHAGKAVSRDAIMTKLWESDSFVDDNTLTVNITRLRKKLEGEGLKDFIITKKGLGYMV